MPLRRPRIGQRPTQLAPQPAEEPADIRSQRERVMAASSRVRQRDEAVQQVRGAVPPQLPTRPPTRLRGRASRIRRPTHRLNPTRRSETTATLGRIRIKPERPPPLNNARAPTGMGLYMFAVSRQRGTSNSPKCRLARQGYRQGCSSPAADNPTTKPHRDAARALSTQAKHKPRPQQPRTLGHTSDRQTSHTSFVANSSQEEHARARRADERPGLGPPALSGRRPPGPRRTTRTP